MSVNIDSLIKDSAAAIGRLAEPEYAALIRRMGSLLAETYRAGNKILVCGNGGSASDAQHLVAELVVRFEKNRAALPALALTTNTSTLTATGNDFSFDEIFSRQVEALAAPGDLLIGISTSGNSPNVLKAVEAARARKAVTLAFTGQTGGKLKAAADICFCAPAAVTARVQECHILVIHLLSSLVEETLFGANGKQ